MDYYGPTSVTRDPGIYHADGAGILNKVGRVDIESKDTSPKPRLVLDRVEGSPFHLDEVIVKLECNAARGSAGSGVVAGGVSKLPLAANEGSGSAVKLEISAPYTANDTATMQFSHKTPSITLTVKVKRIP